MVRFEWDEDKNQKNKKKHGIWFEEAKLVFDDPHVQFILDHDYLDHEERYVAIGFSTNRLLVVVYCYRDNDSIIRIISAREATFKERIKYEEGI